MFGDKLPDLRYKFRRNFHNSLIQGLKSTLIFRYGLFFGLGFVMDEHSFDLLLIPPWRELTLFHFLFLR